MKVFVIDINKCNGCHNCQVACKDEHCNQAWPPYTEMQPEVGQFWMKVDGRERGQVPWTRISYVPIMCQHCENPSCQSDAVYKREDGMVILDPAKATDQSIVEKCPVGAIYWNDELGIAQKCNGCAHLLDSGWEVPRCVDVCATDALLYGNEEDFDLSGCEHLDSVDESMGSRVYYRNLPKRFVAGTVFDPEAKEVLIGAAVELRADGEKIALLETDDFGDFKFDQVEPRLYEIRIVANGYREKTIEVNLTNKDKSVGDVAMEAC